MDWLVDTRYLHVDVVCSMSYAKGMDNVKMIIFTPGTQTMFKVFWRTKIFQGQLGWRKVFSSGSGAQCRPF